MQVLAIVERSRIDFQMTTLVTAVEDILKVTFPKSPRIDVCPSIAQKILYFLLNRLIKPPLTYLKLADNDKPAYIRLSPFPIVLYSP